MALFVQGFVHGAVLAPPSCLNVVAPALPSGSLQAIVYAGKDPLTGKERYERETAKTYQAAEAPGVNAACKVGFPAPEAAWKPAGPKVQRR